MELSRIASINKSIQSWRKALIKIKDSEKAQNYQKLLGELNIILASAWQSGKLESEQEQQIETLRTQIDRMYDESRLLG